MLYKNRSAVFDSIFGVLTINTKTWRGFEIPFVILKLLVLCRSLVIITLQAFPSLLQIKFGSFSISKFISVFVFGSKLSSNASKNEYLLSGISQFTVVHVPNSAFLEANPSLKVPKILSNHKPTSSAPSAAFPRCVTVLRINLFLFALFDVSRK